jgi:hypothetical protein
MEVIATGQQPVHTSLIPRDRMDIMGRDLIQLCDQLEPHGLVDYQMGVWEEEILSGEFALYSNYTYITSYSYQIQSWVNALISWTVDPISTTSLPDPKPRQYHDHESCPKEETEEQKTDENRKKKSKYCRIKLGPLPNTKDMIDDDRRLYTGYALNQYISPKRCRHGRLLPTSVAPTPMLIIDITKRKPVTSNSLRINQSRIRAESSTPSVFGHRSSVPL